jgi:hypothetical protein
VAAYDTIGNSNVFAWIKSKTFEYNSIVIRIDPAAGYGYILATVDVETIIIIAYVVKD